MEMMVKTGRKEEFVDITDRVQEVVSKSGVSQGVCYIFIPHTTAGITINENADPDVVRDILSALDRVIPDHWEFRHAEGNSPAHIKASLMGCSLYVLVKGGQLALGTWQGIYLCEFDGPRTRKVWVEVK